MNANDKRYRSVLWSAALLFSSVILCGCLDPTAPENLKPLRQRAEMCIDRAFVYPENPAIRAQACEAAAEVLGPDAFSMLRAGLDDDHAGVRFAAAMALGDLRDEGARDDLQALVNDPNINVRIAAFYALERIGGPLYRTEWARLLRQSEDVTVRRNAVMALGRLMDRSTMPLLRKVTVMDDDESVRMQAFEALALLGDREVISHFMFQAYGGQDYKQPFAIQTLGKINDEEVIKVLRARLEGAPYMEARLAAARGLGAHGYADGYDLALRSLNWNEPDPSLPDDSPADQVMRVQSMAAAALGKIGDPAALNPLHDLMENSGDPRIQLSAATAILEIINKIDRAPIGGR